MRRSYPVNVWIVSEISFNANRFSVCGYFVFHVVYILRHKRLPDRIGFISLVLLLLSRRCHHFISEHRPLLLFSFRPKNGLRERFYYD